MSDLDATAVRAYIVEQCPESEVVDASGGSFFFTDPDKQFPFATLVTSDEYDQASELSRPGVFRLNIGLGKHAFAALFAGPPTEHDFTQCDRIMPHPVYGKMYWICVLNPGPRTFDTVQRLLREAYDAGMQKRRERAERK